MNISKFFIDRPIFAWVVAIFICIAGLPGSLKGLEASLDADAAGYQHRILRLLVQVEVVARGADLQLHAHQ